MLCNTKHSPEAGSIKSAGMIVSLVTGQIFVEHLLGEQYIHFQNLENIVEHILLRGEEKKRDSNMGFYIFLMIYLYFSYIFNKSQIIKCN